MNKIIIIGAGFAGLSAAKRLAGSGLGLEITLLDRKEKFDFLPLIPDCLGRGINPEFLAYDIASLCRKFKIKFIQQEVVAIDFELKSVSTRATTQNYDFLVIASGSQTNFFANQAAQDYSYPLNSLKDLRSMIKALAENKFDNFVICGGGYTGIEAATNLWLYFKNNGLAKKIVIVERMPEILGVLPGWMKAYVGENLKRMGIEVIAKSVIENIQVDKVALSTGQVFDRAMLIWVPGVRTADFIQKLSIEKNPQGRIVVDEYLRANPYCFCAGDTAFFGKQNSSLRMAIQFAIKEGDQAAKNIIRRIKNTPLKKFRPLDLGYIIPMANNNSCGVVFSGNVRGLLATLLHFTMCIFRSSGLKNKAGIISNLIKSLPYGKQGGV
jgi:NADH:ubiquinone reductase (H+-translocating)